MEFFVLLYRWFRNNEELYDSLRCLFLNEEHEVKWRLTVQRIKDPGQKTKERLYYCIYCIALLVNKNDILKVAPSD